MARKVRFLVALTALLLLMWGAGFVFYLHKIHSLLPSQDPADGIVILTGGAGRIHKGLKLLNQKTLPLLISGVKGGELLEGACYSPQKQQITLGKNATNTKENAQETKTWAAHQGCKSLKVVTSYYHMPRSLLELKILMPGVALHPYPVVSSRFQNFRWISHPRLWGVLFVEYNKYLAVLAQSFLIL